MSFFNLDDLHNFSLSGHTLNPEERTLIRSTLLVKKQEEKLSELYFWGKIFGVNKDYYIAQGITDTADLFTRKYFYSIDLVNWLQLNNVTVEEIMKIKDIHARFYGDPAYEYPSLQKETQESVVAPAAEDGVQEAPTLIINEEKRLAGVVALINYEAQIVPRGAYYRNAMNELKQNPSFTGLQKFEVGELTSYFHFRAGDFSNKKLLEKTKKFEENIDLFKPISEDQPKGVWSLNLEQGGETAILRNLMWPGYTFFHSPHNSKSGSMYIGTGQRNTTIGFML